MQDTLTIEVDWDTARHGWLMAVLDNTDSYTLEVRGRGSLRYSLNVKHSTFPRVVTVFVRFTRGAVTGVEGSVRLNDGPASKLDGPSTANDIWIGQSVVEVP